MSYLTWRNSNEDRYMHQVDNGEIIPCFADSAYCAEGNQLVERIVEQITSKPAMNLITFPAVFAEYLFEEYDMKPVDVEILCQTCYKLLFAQIDKTAQTTAQMIIQAMNMAQDNDQEEKEGDTE